MRRILAAVAILWLARWAAMELAAYAGRRWLPPGRPALDAERPPGLMPGPFDD